jgi:hypothetical protein
VPAPIQPQAIVVNQVFYFVQLRQHSQIMFPRAAALLYRMCSIRILIT